MPKILCPFHKEDTPSLVIYPNGYHCFGCGRSGPLSDLNGVSVPVVIERPKEDMSASIKRIMELPKNLIRGLSLPYDEQGYYIVWPDRTYYKKRLWEAVTSAKYQNPTGHTQPPLAITSKQTSLAVLIEGEINALSVSLACPEITVVSPGSASQFSSEYSMRKYLKCLESSSTILILTDRDEAGAKACIEALSLLTSQRLGKVLWKLMPKDANEILVERGKEQLRQTILGYFNS